MKFEEDYYVNSHVSNYSNYTTKKFRGIASNIINGLKIEKSDKILDFGCATGGLIKAFIEEELENITGTDISYWAIDYGRKEFKLSTEVLQHYNRQLLEQQFHCILFLDVLEHIPSGELKQILSRLQSKYIIVRVPVSAKEGENFVLKISQNDITHIQIHCKEWWEKLLNDHKYCLYKIFHKKYIYDSNGVLSRIYKRMENDSCNLS